MDDSEQTEEDGNRGPPGDDATLSVDDENLPGGEERSPADNGRPSGADGSLPGDARPSADNEDLPPGVGEAPIQPEQGDEPEGFRDLGVTLGVAVVLFVVAVGLSIAITRPVLALFEVGEPGTVSRLLVGIAGLQVAGFGTVGIVFLSTREEDWRSYLRLGELTDWILFYGTSVGLALMLLTVAATVLFNLLGIEAAESSTGAPDNPLFYVVLFAASTFVAAPMEEIFFRGIIQRYLEESFHGVVAILATSLLFTLIHSGINVGSGGEILAFGLFFSFGLALGISYYLTENLFVPIIGHVMFNGIQILVQTLRVVT